MVDLSERHGGVGSGQILHVGIDSKETNTQEDQYEPYLAGVSVHREVN